MELTNRREKLVCSLKSCQFEGIKLKRHLTGKSHKLDKNDANLRQSYLTQKIKLCLLYS